MDQCIKTKNSTFKKALVKKAHKVNGDALQLGGVLAQQLNNYKPHWSKPVTGSRIAFQLC